MEVSMSIGAALWFIMTLGGAVLLGVALAYGLMYTRKRRENPVAQRLTNAATRELYRQEEVKRAREERSDVVNERERSGVTVTEARQSVSGHNVNIVLVVSLLLAVIAGVGLAYFWMHPALLSR
jgi:Flp pilus assembly protein TadB